MKDHFTSVEYQSSDPIGPNQVSITIMKASISLLEAFHTGNSNSIFFKVLTLTEMAKDYPDSFNVAITFLKSSVETIEKTLSENP